MQANAVQNWEASSATNMSWCLRLFPSLTDFAFVLPAFLLFTFLGGTARLLTDGDTGWHIRTGEWILQHGIVPKTDLFSFTKPHDAWFAWEWGWDATFAFVHRCWGLAGVAFINTCILCAISVLLFRLIRRCCGHDVLSFVFSIIAVCGSAIHWLARPHLLSWLLVVIFLHVLLSAREGNVKQLCCLPLLTVVWTNFHGGFFIGILLVCIAAVGELSNAALGRDASWASAYAKAGPYLLCGAACSAATLVNPYGWHLHQHIYSYLRDSNLLDRISEYQSVSFHHAGAVFFECMLLCGAGAVWWCLQNGEITGALAMVVWAHLALFSGRNIPLFMLIASPWAGCMCRDFLSRIEWAPTMAKVANGIKEACQDLRHFERVERFHVASMLAVLVLAVLFASGRPGFAGQFDPKQFPIEAVPGLEDLSKSRVFTYDQWGDYLIYRFPATKVFMDGRSDFYGSEFVDTYLQVINAGYNWESNLNRFQVTTVVLKPDAPLATVLKKSGGWRLIFDNGRVIVFAAGPNGRTPVMAHLQLSPVSHKSRNGLEPRATQRVSQTEFIIKKGEANEHFSSEGTLAG